MEPQYTPPPSNLDQADSYQAIIIQSFVTNVENVLVVVSLRTSLILDLGESWQWFSSVLLRSF